MINKDIASAIISIILLFICTYLGSFYIDKNKFIAALFTGIPVKAFSIIFVLFIFSNNSTLLNIELETYFNHLYKVLFILSVIIYLAYLYLYNKNKNYN